MKRLKQYNWRAIAIALLVVILSFGVWQYLSTKTNQAQTLKKLESKQAELSKKTQELDSTKLNAKQLEEAKKKLEQQKQELEKQLQAKRSTPKVYAESLPKPAQAVGTTNCGSDPYMAQIYQRESGCRTTALNSIGCYGIGQSCPASKIAHCGADFACQNAWFTNYAVTRYGSTANAWAVWQQQHWW